MTDTLIVSGTFTTTGLDIASYALRRVRSSGISESLRPSTRKVADALASLERGCITRADWSVIEASLQALWGDLMNESAEIEAHVVNNVIESLTQRCEKKWPQEDNGLAELRAKLSAAPNMDPSREM